MVHLASTRCSCNAIKYPVTKYAKKSESKAKSSILQSAIGVGVAAALLLSPLSTQAEPYVDASAQYYLVRSTTVFILELTSSHKVVVASGHFVHNLAVFVDSCDCKPTCSECSALSIPDTPFAEYTMA
jgi:hypothetical protein